VNNNFLSTLSLWLDLQIPCVVAGQTFGAVLHSCKLDSLGSCCHRITLAKRLGWSRTPSELLPLHVLQARHLSRHASYTPIITFLASYFGGIGSGSLWDSTYPHKLDSLGSCCLRITSAKHLDWYQTPSENLTLLAAVTFAYLAG
jgi:hypothetical protein